MPGSLRTLAPESPPATPVSGGTQGQVSLSQVVQCEHCPLSDSME